MVEWQYKDIADIIEDVQRRATKLIPEIKHLSYPERLRKLKLPTLSYRRIRGQMIEVYKIINNILYIYDRNVSENILTFRPNADFNLRGNDYTLEQGFPTFLCLFPKILLGDTRIPP